MHDVAGRTCGISPVRVGWKAESGVSRGRLAPSLLPNTRSSEPAWPHLDGYVSVSTEQLPGRKPLEVPVVGLSGLCWDDGGSRSRKVRAEVQPNRWSKSAPKFGGQSLAGSIGTAPGLCMAPSTRSHAPSGNSITVERHRRLSAQRADAQGKKRGFQVGALPYGHVLRRHGGSNK